jgi:hypothetical protein
MPEDYTFVPKGDPYITRHCKSRAKQADKIVYIVYVRPHTLPSILTIKTYY